MLSPEHLHLSRRCPAALARRQHGGPYIAANKELYEKNPPPPPPGPATCNPTVKPPQLCPGNKPRPQCGKPSCPCPAGTQRDVRGVAGEAELFHQGALLTDTDNNIIRAHQPHVYRENGTYYLLGSAHVGASEGAPGQVNMYSSGGLHSWKLKIGGVYNSTGDTRPSLLGRNPRTGRYVLWAKGGSFQSATAPTLRGPYTNVGRYKPERGVHRRRFVVLPGSGQRQGLHGVLSTPAGDAAVLTVYCATKHYIWSSHTSGWKPNPAELLVSSDGMGGPWTSLGNPSNNHTTFSTQGARIEKLPGPNPPGVERFLYVGDRYIPYIATKEGSRYIFLALELHADWKVVLFPDQPWDPLQGRRQSHRRGGARRSSTSCALARKNGRPNNAGSARRSIFRSCSKPAARLFARNRCARRARSSLLQTDESCQSCKHDIYRRYCFLYTHDPELDLCMPPPWMHMCHPPSQPPS